MSLAWTIYDPSVKALPLYPMNVASNWDEFSAALKIWPWPTLNMVYSDDKGHIAYHAVGGFRCVRAACRACPLPMRITSGRGTFHIDEYAQTRWIRRQAFWPRPTRA